jgi:hypothetical protein
MVSELNLDKISLIIGAYVLVGDKTNLPALIGAFATLSVNYVFPEYTKSSGTAASKLSGYFSAKYL